MKINNVSTTQRIVLVLVCLFNMSYAADKPQTTLPKECSKPSTIKQEKIDEKKQEVFNVVRFPHIDKKSGRFLKNKDILR